MNAEEENIIGASLLQGVVDASGGIAEGETFSPTANSIGQRDGHWNHNHDHDHVGDEEAEMGEGEEEGGEEGEEEGEEEEDESTTVAQDPNKTYTESITIKATPELMSLTNPNLREISLEGVWTLSSCKPGNGVTQLIDCSIDTYWQSDGTQPHLINIHFSKRKAVCEVAFYLDYTLDESYTPKRIGIKAGTTFHDLEEIKVVEMNEPTGWVSVPLHAKIDPLDDVLNDCCGGGEDDFLSNDKRVEERERKLKSRPLRAHLIQICILTMAQNGRDTHVRQVKLFGPRAGSDAESSIKASSVTGFALGLPRFQTVELSQFSTIR
mmetsp:Transcript_14356/g.26957  ORF Transcript_14356/g.26957 Transcript_14356/m.26957 type:complete len:323 (+) Transcript_14356:112-1080(+)